jgi:hypothetical protein
MIAKNILGYKLGTTKDEMTAQAGLALFGEFIRGLGVLDFVDKRMPKPGNKKGFKPSVYVHPLLLMLNGGGRSLEDTREITNDKGLRRLLKLRKVPSPDALGDWLRKMGDRGGLEGLLEVNRDVLDWGMRKDNQDGYTLDIDATEIIAEKYEALWTYNGNRGYMPIVGHIAESGMVLCDDFREGNVSPGTRNLEFIKQCEEQLPSGKRIEYFRSDSAAYQGKIIDYCMDKGIEFAIGADLDEAVRKLINEIPENEWRKYESGKIAEAVHTMNKNKYSFRLIVISKPYQADVFDDVDPKCKFKVIATNRTEPAEWVVDWYRKRCDCSENRIKDLKIGFSMERMPCGQFNANAVFFRIGVIAYNLYKLFATMVLDKGWRKFQVQSVRWKLYQTAGKVVFHAGRLYLKISEEMYELFARIRHKSREFVVS